ncbi:hypothetical protein Prudu_020279 [Prunus dulcis]|uniref:Uncharacterized protein n=1 Tax=Prunus dulcis TaxID=3755 RepID=A0A4Y1RUV7_PRUDU|nr:hypothetical protein Prudu_020279 [Prunus dulcis]
MSSQNKPSL